MQELALLRAQLAAAHQDKDELQNRLTECRREHEEQVGFKLFGLATISSQLDTTQVHELVSQNETMKHLLARDERLDSAFTTACTGDATTGSQ